MIQRLSVLVLGVISLWCVLAVGMFAFYDSLEWSTPRDVILIHAAVAMVICLAPAVVTFAWAARRKNAEPEQQIAVALGGSGFRMFFVLAVSWLLNSQFAYFQQSGYWLWVVTFYMFTLALEITVLVYNREPAPVPDATPDAGELAP